MIRIARGKFRAVKAKDSAGYSYFLVNALKIGIN